MGQLKEVVAYEAFGIYADYDGNAPDTTDLIIVADEEVAKGLVADFNRNPRAIHIAYVDGCETSKSYAYRRIAVFSTSGVSFTRSDALDKADLTEEDLANPADDSDD